MCAIAFCFSFLFGRDAHLEHVHDYRCVFGELAYKYPAGKLRLAVTLRHRALLRIRKTLR